MIAKKLLTTIAFAFVLLFSGCAKDDFQEVDGVCPLVISTIPTSDAVGVPLNQIITATFNEVMKPSTITSTSFLVSANGAQIAGTVTYAGSTATFTPNAPLLPNTEYTGTITTLASDSKGNFLQENYVWTFTTLKTFTVGVSSNPTIGGITAGGGTFVEGTTVTLTATPNPLYTFDNWTEGGAIVPGAGATYQFVLAGNRTLVANYSLIPPTQFAVIVSSNPILGGVTTGAGLYDEGLSVTVTATPNAGFTFANWTEGGVIVPGATATYQFVIANDRTLVANYVPVQFTIALSSSPLMGGTTGGAGTFDTGTTRTITATAAVGYDFANWTEGGVIVPGAGASYQFVLTGNRTLVANFVVEPPLQFTVMLIADPNDGGIVTGGGSFDEGSLVPISANANAGYTFVNWTDINGVEVSTNGTFEFLLTEDSTLQANFILDTVAIGECPNPAVDLGTAKNYAILAESGISTTGTTSVTGDMGIFPLEATYITGFDLILTAGAAYSTSSLVTGKIYAPSYAVPTPTNLNTAVNDMHTAFTTANGLAVDVTEYLAGNLNGQTLTTGVYKWGTGLSITNGITLDGGGQDCAKFVFIIGQDLTVGDGAIITLTNGAKADNIFWVVAGSKAELGTTVQFQGNILSKTLISLNTGATINGRLLAQTAVTLNAATVVKP
ncbi:MAG: hypothetical protein APF83_12840 [Lutibacter sp. BRH_c52]|nr:MAG: hypothetical protein APF83_12840 [Lutibacter sp. BRH_c52]HCE53778.1 hypothetical protein [Lutibacter sp.]